MKLNLAAVLFTSINAAALGTNLVWRGASDDVQPLLRARRIELVDQHGVVRSLLKTEESGEVVLRLFDPTGTIRVKLGAGADGSGLLLADETTEPGIHLLARRAPTSERPATTNLTLTGAGDAKKVIQP